MKTLKKPMKLKTLTLLASVLILSLTTSITAFAKGDLTKQDTIEIHVALGDKNNAMSFTPSTLEFETGKLYKLVIENKGPVKHYFSSDGFSRAVFTRKVQINDNNGKAMAEIKGSVREIEVYPGYKAQWWFVPVQTGTFNDLRCSIKGHTEMGMKGSIIIK
jgi:uncharacterized cupredoxin-like copper-binding protein